MKDNGIQFSLPAAKPNQSVSLPASQQPFSERALDQLEQAQEMQAPVFTSANVSTMLNQSMDMVRLMLGSAIPPQALPVSKSVFTLDKPLNNNTANAKAPKKNTGSLLESILGIDLAEIIESNETTGQVQGWLGQVRENMEQALSQADAKLQQFQDAVVRLDKMTDEKIDRLSQAVKDKVMGSIQGNRSDIQGHDQDGNS